MQQFVNPFENKVISYHTPNNYYNEQNHSNDKSSTGKFALFFGILSLLLLLFGVLFLIIRKQDLVEEGKGEMLLEEEEITDQIPEVI